MMGAMAFHGRAPTVKITRVVFIDVDEDGWCQRTLLLL